MEAIRLLQEKINAHFEYIETELNKYVQKGNKAAGQRARVKTIQLERLFKALRKLTIENDKK